MIKYTTRWTQDYTNWEPMPIVSLKEANDVLQRIMKL